MHNNLLCYIAYSMKDIFMVSMYHISLDYLQNNHFIIIFYNFEKSGIHENIYFSIVRI